MSDDYEEVSSEGWLSRIGGSIKGVLIGLLLFFAAFPLLWWNEGRAVQTYRSLEEGAGAVVSVSAGAVDPAQEGSLVHLSGLATTEDVLVDPVFGVAASALRLERRVEMYQWVEDVDTETRKKAGGKKETTKTYSYSKEWRSSPVDSSDFKKPSGHANPSGMPYRSESWLAGDVTVGAFSLSDSLKSDISSASVLAVDEDALPSAVARDFRVTAAGLYSGENPSSPVVGDLRVSFRQVLPTHVSVIAQQGADRLSAYQTKAGDSLEMLTLGHTPAEEMFAAAQRTNSFLTWGLRLVGFILMGLGMSMVFKPLSVVADVIPLIGDIVGMGTGIIAFVIAAPCTLVTIGVAWLFYRPLLGVALIVGSVALVVVVKVLAARQ